MRNIQLMLSRRVLYIVHLAGTTNREGGRWGFPFFISNYLWCHGDFSGQETSLLLSKQVARVSLWYIFWSLASKPCFSNLFCIRFMSSSTVFTSHARQAQSSIKLSVSWTPPSEMTRDICLMSVSILGIPEKELIHQAEMKRKDIVNKIHIELCSFFAFSLLVVGLNGPTEANAFLARLRSIMCILPTVPPQRWIAPFEIQCSNGFESFSLLPACHFIFVLLYLYWFLGAIARNLTRLWALELWLEISSKDACKIDTACSIPAWLISRCSTLKIAHPRQSDYNSQFFCILYSSQGNMLINCLWFLWCFGGHYCGDVPELDHQHYSPGALRGVEEALYVGNNNSHGDDASKCRQCLLLH